MEILQVNREIKLFGISMDDAPDIFETIDTQRDYLSEWLPFINHTKELSYTKQFIQSVLEQEEEERNPIFVIRYMGRFAGIIGFRDTDRINFKTEIGYWLSESFQKKGIVIQSVQRLLEYAFKKMQMNRVQIRCATGNMPSKSVPLRLGFHLEGIERAGEHFPDGHFKDLEVYSLLKKEFIK